MKKLTLITITLLLCSCSTQDYYLFMARETVTPATRGEYYKRAQEIESRKHRECDCHKQREFAVGYGSFLISSS